MEPLEICQYLEWDSHFFGIRIGRVLRSRLRAEDIERIRRWCRVQRVDCLYFLADPDDQPTVALAEEHGFRFVDIRMTLECRLNTVSSAAADDTRLIIRPATLQDIPSLRAIAGISHRDTRFYYDPHFERERCSALYETWIENSCRGHAQAVLVAEVHGAAQGYITCDLNDDQTGQIGLIAVAPAYQGQGIGQRLVSQGLRWLAGQGMKQARVVTQGRNVNAQRLYGRTGFLTCAVQIWYHRWFTP